MKSWRDVLIPPETAIEEATSCIDCHPAKIALVVDANERLLGTITDGDLRRAILNNASPHDPVSRIMNPNPVKACPSNEPGELLERMRARQILQIPIVDASNRVIGLEALEDLLTSPRHENPVVLMVGGMGSRLRPLTEECPKPMLKVGDRPLLETILLKLIEHGFSRFYVSVNYRAELIREHFGDGSRWQVQIAYLHETSRMGTAGALGLLPEQPNGHPILVINGDVLTKMNFTSMLDFHAAYQSQATMAVREYNIEVPYGVVSVEVERITRIEEKPRMRFFVSAGIYLLEQGVVRSLATDKYLDMPVLFERLIGNGCRTTAFPIREYWLDVGLPADLDRAVTEYSKIFQ